MFCKIGALKKFFKFTRKHLSGYSLFNKVTALLKAEIPIQVFSDEFFKINKTPFLQNTYRRLLLFYGNHNLPLKYSRAPCKNKKEMEPACKKNNDTRWKKLMHYLHQIFISFHYSKISLWLFSLLSHNTLKARVFRNNAMPLKIYQL